MKRIITVLTVLLILSVSLLSVSAASNSIEFSADYSYNEQDDLYVFRVSIGKIADPSGIALFETDITIDTKVFEFVDEQANIPEKWKPYFDESLEEGVEDLSHFENESTYVWSFCAIKEGIAITDDGELFVDVILKAKTEAETVIKVKTECVANDLCEDLGFNNLTVKVSTVKGSDVSAEISDEPVSEPTVSDEPSKATSDDPSVISIPPVIEDESEASESENSDESKEEKEENNTVLFVILGVIAAAVVAGVGVAVAKNSKGKKK